MPVFEKVVFPAFVNGCNVYRTNDAFRVMPAPGESRYGKKFPFATDSEQVAFDKMGKYVCNPTIPTESSNHVPINWVWGLDLN